MLLLLHVLWTGTWLLLRWLGPWLRRHMVQVRPMRIRRRMRMTSPHRRVDRRTVGVMSVADRFGSWGSGGNVGWRRPFAVFARALATQPFTSRTSFAVGRCDVRPPTALAGLVGAIGRAIHANKAFSGEKNISRSVFAGKPGGPRGLTSS